MSDFDASLCEKIVAMLRRRLNSARLSGTEARLKGEGCLEVIANQLEAACAEMTLLREELEELRLAASGPYV